jgi:hypothetical protein
MKLPPELYSPEQLQYVATELNDYAIVLAERRRGQRGTRLPQLSDDSQLMLETLVEKDRDKDHEIAVLAAEIEQALRGGKIVSVTLAASPSRKLKTEIVEWFRTQIDPQMLIRFLVNPDIAGGMVVRTTSRIHDYSFRNRLLEKPDRFTKALENV